MKNRILISLLITTTIFSCATPELCSSYTDYYSKKLTKNDYCHGSKVDRKRKKLFEKYFENSKKPTTSLITIEYITKNADLSGYAMYFIKPSDRFYTSVYYKTIDNNKVILKDRFFYYDETMQQANEDFLVRYIWENGIDLNLDYFKNNDDYMLGKDFGKTIITEFDKNLEVKNSKVFDFVIYLSYTKIDF